MNSVIECLSMSLALFLPFTLKHFRHFNSRLLYLLGIPPTPTSSSVSKKNSSRRNAWGNLSYADLITKAIGSAADNRLTLSQIYEWMVTNVPYFKDKGDSNSSAGWKVSFEFLFFVLLLSLARFIIKQYKDQLISQIST